MPFDMGTDWAGSKTGRLRSDGEKTFCSVSRLTRYSSNFRLLDDAPVKRLMPRDVAGTFGGQTHVLRFAGRGF
jgi:hypothetical protein